MDVLIHNMAEITSYHAGTYDGPVKVNYYILLNVTMHCYIILYNITCYYILLYLPRPDVLCQPPLPWTRAHLNHDALLPWPTTTVHGTLTLQRCGRCCVMMLPLPLSLLWHGNSPSLLPGVCLCCGAVSFRCRDAAGGNADVRTGDAVDNCK